MAEREGDRAGGAPAAPLRLPREGETRLNLIDYKLDNPGLV